MEMKTSDMIKALHGLAKKGMFANHQERELVRCAALRLSLLDSEARYLRAKLDAANQMVMELEDDGK